MSKGFSLSLAAALLLPLSATLFAAGDTGLEQEYLQVRKIALKDPKVQEAFAKANERLNEKILQIDPSLKPVVDRQPRAAAPVPFASPRPGTTYHMVVKGETLSSIAAHYKVKVAALEKLNHITDDRKLQVGQKLIIPTGASSAATTSLESRPAAESPTPKPAESGSLLDRLKSSL